MFVNSNIRMRLRKCVIHNHFIKSAMRMEWMIENKQRKWNRTFAENLLPLHPRLYLRWSLFLFDHIRIAKK